jgi:hypothetical protein
MRLKTIASVEACSSSRTGEAVEITGNTVEGNLQSKENTPAPVVAGNTVSGDTEIDSSPPPPTPVKPAAHIPLLLLAD